MFWGTTGSGVLFILYKLTPNAVRTLKCVTDLVHLSKHVHIRICTTSHCQGAPNHHCMHHLLSILLPFDSEAQSMLQVPRLHVSHTLVRRHAIIAKALHHTIC